MIDKSLIPDKIKSFEYYKNKLPLYLQESYGFQEHFKIWHELLVGNNANGGLVGNAEILLNLLCIFHSDYLQYIADLEDSGATETDKYGTHCDILDKIGSIYGVTRYFSPTSAYSGYLNLNNEDFLLLIKTQLIKNYCEGTSKQINDYYKDVGLKMYVQTSDSPAVANLYLAEGDAVNYSDNVRTMFEAGLLEINSMGIIYRRQFLDLDRLLTWDVINQTNTNGWDGGQWVL